MNDEEIWENDWWCQYLPALHRTLAAPGTEQGLPQSFARLDFEQTCAWWETLRYLFRALLGWRNLPGGLAWWYEAGKPALDDPRLTLVRERWDTCGELDFFAAREWEMQGYTGGGIDVALTWPAAGYEPCPGWWREFKARAPFAPHGPYGGGYNPLHLGHSDEVGQNEPAGPGTGFHDAATRRAVLIVHSFDSWARELREFGATLPALGDRSWHVEVFDRQVGCLGVFRQSRVTGQWFQGRHSIHLAGNSTSLSPKPAPCPAIE